MFPSSPPPVLLSRAPTSARFLLLSLVPKCGRNIEDFFLPSRNGPPSQPGHPQPCLAQDGGFAIIPSPSDVPIPAMSARGTLRLKLRFQAFCSASPNCPPPPPLRWPLICPQLLVYLYFSGPYVVRVFFERSCSYHVRSSPLSPLAERPFDQV